MSTPTRYLYFDTITRSVGNQSLGDTFPPWGKIDPEQKSFHNVFKGYDYQICEGNRRHRNVDPMKELTRNMLVTLQKPQMKSEKFVDSFLHQSK